MGESLTMCKSETGPVRGNINHASISFDTEGRTNRTLMLKRKCDLSSNSNTLQIVHVRSTAMFNDENKKRGAKIALSMYKVYSFEMSLSKRYSKINVY